MPIPQFFYAYVEQPNGHKFFVAGINDIFLSESEYKVVGDNFCEAVPCTEIEWIESSQIFCCKPTEELLRTLGVVHS